MKLLLILATSLLGLSDVFSQIIAKIDTNLRLFPDDDENFETRFFYVQLNHQAAPLATANFMLLAGLEDEIWLGNVGELLPAPHLPYSPIRPGRGYTRTGRLPLNIVFQEANPGVPGDVDKYVIRQNTTVFGIVSTTPSGDVYKSLTGASRLEIRRDPIANRFYIVINHDRTWLDSRFFAVRSDPMYQNIPVTKIEPGLRLISGSFSNRLTDGPGYTFPDELTTGSGTGYPWRSDFNNGWALAMDSPGLNANGSRFFFTGQPTAQNNATLTEWNRRYTSFGTVLIDGGGRNVVQDILNFSTTEDGSPQGSVQIKNITFLRLGGNEVGFFPHLLLDKLPEELSGEQLSIERVGFNSYFLNSPPSPNSQRVFLSAPDLQSQPVVFSTFTKPFDFTTPRENITTIVRTHPRYFFRSFTARLKDWPAQDFDFSDIQITCVYVTPTGGTSGFIQFTFAEAPSAAQEGTFGTYFIQLPARTVDTGQGLVVYPAVTRSGTFNSQMIDDENPNRVRLLLDPPNAASPDEPFMPFDQFILEMDYRRAFSLESRRSRFTAISSSDPFSSISGYWFKSSQ